MYDNKIEIRVLFHEGKNGMKWGKEMGWDNEIGSKEEVIKKFFSELVEELLEDIANKERNGGQPVQTV